jgi:hypothetical protein
MPQTRDGMPTPAEIVEELRRAGQVSRGDTIDLELLPKNPQRADAPATDTYRVSRGGRPWCHLTVGSGLHDRWMRTRTFADACPQIACAPLFFLELGNHALLGVEWFVGASLEHSLRDGALALADSRKIIHRLHATLAATRAPSTTDAAAEEFEDFAAHVLRAAVISEVDRVLLRELVLPFIRDHALRGAVETRVTNADFIARNVLVAGDGSFRLIDCEFAHRTHFFAADAWRWREFSDLPASLLAADPESAGTQIEPWVEMYSILQHLTFAEASQGRAVAVAEARVRLPRLFAVLSAACPRLRASLLWPILTTAAPPRPAGPADRTVTAQLFWSVSGAFNEAESRRITYASGAEARLVFLVPRASGSVQLRFDPAEAPGLIHIASLQVARIAGGTPVPIWSLATGHASIHLIRGLAALRSDRGLNLLSLDIDPCLLLPAITVGAEPSDLVVEVSIRHDSDLGALPGLLPR